MKTVQNTIYAEHPSFVTAYGASIDNGGDDATNSDVVNMINYGYHLINHRGYGDYNYWGGNVFDISAGWNVLGENFSNTQINNLTDNTNAVFFSISRKTGDISTPGNMLESFTRPFKGAVAFLGSTTGECLSANFYYNLYLYKKLFNDGIHQLGDISIGALFESYYYYGLPDIFKDNAYSYICGGDPALELWTDSPVGIGVTDLTTSGKTITINTTISGDYYISVSSEDGDLIGHYYCSSNSCTFTKPSGNFWLSVHKHNYIPRIVYFNTDAEYVQNVSFNYDAYYNSTPLSLGEGVTPDVPDGDVIVKTGSKLSIKNGPGGILLDGGFECEKGAILEIE